MGLTLRDRTNGHDDRVAGRKAKRRCRSRRWHWRRFSASMLCSRLNGRSMARVPSSAERCGRSSAHRWSLIWKTGCASTAPSSRATMTSPRRWLVVSAVGVSLENPVVVGEMPPCDGRSRPGPP